MTKTPFQQQFDALAVVWDGSRWAAFASSVAIDVARLEGKNGTVLVGVMHEGYWMMDLEVA